MKKDKLADALNEIRNDFISEAAKKKKKPTAAVFSAVAAGLALVLLAGIFFRPWQAPQAQVPSVTTAGIGPGDPSWNVPIDPQPDFSGNIPVDPTDDPVPPDPPAYLCNVISLANVSNHVPTRAPKLAEQMRHFFGKSMITTLTRNPGTNKSYSPANLYLALSTLAELSCGDEELMGLLGAEDLDVLRTYANQLWNVTRFYEENRDVTSLANSIWLEEGLQYDQAIMDTLAQNYFTDSFYGDLGSGAVNARIASWVDHHTGHLLQEQTKNIQLDPSTDFALYSTIYYKVQWMEPFLEERNTGGAFFGTEKTVATYMNKSDDMLLYRGSNFTAICNPLNTGGMWLILPDEGWTPEEIANGEEYLDLVLGLRQPESEYCMVNLSLPKFDIQTNSSLKEDLHIVGIHNIFNSEKDPFGAFIQTNADGGTYVQQITQATRVCVDEWGVTAANYVEVQAPADSVPPEKEVDFVLDRPFLYVITNSANLPLFAGIVNQVSEA